MVANRQKEDATSGTHFHSQCLLCNSFKMLVGRCDDPQASREASSGFTLIELLVVIAVMAVIVGIAAPMFTGFNQANRLNRAAQLLTADLNLARQMAITRRQTVHVLFPDDPVRMNDYAFTRYAPYSSEEGYLGGWRSLPEGIIFLPADGVYNLFEVGDDYEEWVDNVPLPGGPSTNTFSFLALSFRPDGVLNIQDPVHHGYFRSILLVQGFVHSTGSVFTIKDGHRYAVEVLAASGQVSGSYLDE